MSRLKKFLLISGLVVFGGLALYLGAGKALKIWKDWQAARLAGLSREYADKENWQEAMMSADTALRLNPVQPEASRFMAGMMEASGRWEQAMELYGRLYNSGGGNLEDLKKQAINAARGEYNDPARWLAGLVAEKGDPSFPLVLDAEILLKKGDVKGAYEALQQAMAKGKSRTAQAAMMRFLLANPLRDADADLLEAVLELKGGNDEIALEALAVGLAGGVAPEDRRAEFIEGIRNHPKPSEKILLLADTAELAIDPAAKPRVVEGLVRRLKDGKIADRVTGAMWLNSQGQPREALELVSPEDAMANVIAMRSWLDSTASLGEWDAMLGVLARKDVPLPPHMVRVYTARALKMDGRAAEGDAAYRAALEEFRDKPQEAGEVLEYLHRSGEYAIFNEGLQVQLAKPDQALDMVVRLVPVVLDARDSKRMRDFITLAMESPNLQGNAAILNDADYLDLVLGRPVDAAALRQRQGDNPGDAALLFTLALERLKNGNSRESLALIEDARPDPRALAPNHLTVLACVLAANGRPEDALKVASRIPASRISNEELEMLKSFLSKPAS